MEIKNTLLKHIEPYRTHVDGKGGSVSGKTHGSGESTPARGDRVSLSSVALLHTVAHSVASKTPEMRQEKIDQIKDLLNSGDYSINAKSIARKLLENEALLVGTLEQKKL